MSKRSIFFKEGQLFFLIYAKKAFLKILLVNCCVKMLSKSEFQRELYCRIIVLDESAPHTKVNDFST